MRFIKNKIAVLGDIHIGLHQANNLWHTNSLNFAKWLKRTLNEKDIRDIVILGDVLDNRNEVSVTTLHILAKFFKILEDFNIIITIGNHDCYYSKRSDIHSLGTLNEHPNIKIIDKLVTFNLFGKDISFCPWNVNIQEIPKSDIIMGHFEINSFRMNGNIFCEKGVDSDIMFEKGTLILSGHFHKTEKRNYKKGTIIYVGSTYQQSWGECDDSKGIYILDVENNECEFIVNTESPEHKKIYLSEILDIESFKKIICNIKNNIIKFIIDKEIEPEILDKIIAKINNLEPFLLTVDNIIHNQPDLIDVGDDIIFGGVDIKQDIINFIKEQDTLDTKEECIEYLSNVYDICKGEI